MQNLINGIFFLLLSLAIWRIEFTGKSTIEAMLAILTKYLILAITLTVAIISLAKSFPFLKEISGF